MKDITRIAQINMNDDVRFCVEINNIGDKIFMFRETRMSLDHINNLRSAGRLALSPYTEEEFEAFREWSSSPDEGTLFQMDIAEQVIDAIRRANRIKTLT